jgi:hypothetical protein
MHAGRTMNPVVLLKHLGALLTEEMASRLPCGLPSDNPLQGSYRFNPALAIEGWQLPEVSAAHVRTEEQTLELEVAQYLKRAGTIGSMIEMHGEGAAQDRNGLRSDLEATIADFESIRPFYATTVSHASHGPYNAPPADIVSPDWACVRLLQIHLLFAADRWVRFGSQPTTELTPRAYRELEHDVLDVHYLVLGVLEGSFATNEKKLRRWFRLLRPDGHLFPDDGFRVAPDDTAPPSD